jgi:hypothetical protein
VIDVSRLKSMPTKEKPPQRRLFDPHKAVPELCPFCGQKIDRNSAYSIEPREFAPHMPFVKSNLRRKRRWQAPPWRAMY